jgi:hypothetical protein
MPPLWLVALILAAAAPFCAAGLQAVLETMLRRRTSEVLAKARSTQPAGQGPEKAGQVLEKGAHGEGAGTNRG